MAETSRRYSPRTGSRCGSPPRSLAQYTTSPPRIHALPALYQAAASGLPTLADPGYDGAGIGIHIPVKQPPGGQELHIAARTRNALQRSLRCLGERGFALLTQRWRILQHITASPSKIGDITRAALVLTHFVHGHIK
jgi:DDE superfamily endonuclease